VTKPELELITFDADQTLSDFHGVLPKALAASTAALNTYLAEPVNPEIVQSRKLEIGHRPENARAPLRSLRLETFVELLGDHPERHEIAETLVEIFRDVRFNQIELLDGARELMGMLTGRVRLGWITNANSKPEHLGLNGVFDVVTLAEEIGIHKPDKRIFDHTLANAGVRAPEKWLHVGDDLVTDIGGARGAGGKTVWLDHGTDRPDPALTPDHTVVTLRQLPAVIEEYRLLAPS